MSLEAKKALRRRLRAIRKSIPGELRRAHDAEIIQNLLQLPEYHRALNLFCFLGVPEMSETDTGPIVQHALQSGRIVAAPVILSMGSGPNDPPRMEARVVSIEARTQTTSLGLIEPVRSPILPPADIDVSIVPCLGVSLTGDRIGKGKAFYDRFLAEATGIRICICYEDCIIDPFDAEAHDIPMDLVVTERRVVRIV